MTPGFVPVEPCATAADVIARARSIARRPSTPVVVMPTKPAQQQSVEPAKREARRPYTLAENAALRDAVAKRMTIAEVRQAFGDLFADRSDFSIQRRAIRVGGRMSAKGSKKKINRLPRVELAPDNAQHHEAWAFDADDVAITNALKPSKRIARIIIETVASRTCITADTMRGKTRRASAIRARFAAWLTMRDLTSMSYPEMGLAMGGRDHTSALNGTRRAATWIASDPAFAADVAAIKARVMQITGGRS